MASRSPPSPNAGSVVDALWVTRAVDGLLSGDRHRLLLTVHRVGGGCRGRLCVQGWQNGRCSGVQSCAWGRQCCVHWQRR